MTKIIKNCLHYLKKNFYLCQISFGNRWKTGAKVKRIKIFLIALQRFDMFFHLYIVRINFFIIFTENLRNTKL